MNDLLKHMLTGIDGITFDPARVIGYSSAVAVVGGFLFNSGWATVHGAAFDAQAYGVGAGMVLAGIAAVGAGVAVKAKTEPTP